MNALNKQGAEQDLPADVAGCEALENQLLRDMATIKAQIARAVSRAKAAGHYADNHWFTNANTALRMKQATHQALQTHTATLRKAQKQTEADNFARHFFAAARTILPKNTYIDLLNEAKRLKDAQSREADPD